MEPLIRTFLLHLAKIKLSRTSAKVVGITGTMGKTSTKNAIVRVLETTYRVKASHSGYNTAIGIPLMLFDLESPGKSIVGWLRVVVLALFRTFRKEAWEYVVIEMGVDKKGDMQELVRFIHPHIAVITGIGQMHLAEGQFASEEEIVKEKLHITTHLGKHGVCVYNMDNDWLRGLMPHIESNASLLSYGYKVDADIQASDIESTKDGVSFELSYGREFVPVQASVLGKVHVSILLAAIGVGITVGIPVGVCADALHGYRLPKGRMNLLEGIHESLLIDSSYNASPKAVEAALAVLKEVEAKRHIAVLGQMNELGTYSKTAHHSIGTAAAQHCDLLLCVYGDARIIAEAAEEAGMSKKQIHFFETADEVGVYLQKHIKKGDVLLFKGSQNNVRLEKAIKYVMAEPERAEELLVRQTGIWKEK